jgi:hypothetical protein
MTDADIGRFSALNATNSISYTVRGDFVALSGGSF